jgi:hypothetical protein
MIRILLLSLAVCLAAACDAGDSDGLARDGGGVRFDTVAGFRLGMLLPEARAVAAAQGDALECDQPLGPNPSGDLPDSIAAYLREVDNCHPPAQQYRLQFFKGSLRTVYLPFSDDWERIPVDTLVARLAREMGQPKGRDTYTYDDGRREVLIYWYRKGLPGAANLRCPEDARAADCELEYHLGEPEDS